MVATVIVSAALAIGVAATAVAVIEEGSSEEESSEEESSEEASSEDPPAKKKVKSEEAPAALRLVCDKCDGPHDTIQCPYFKKQREKHPDAQRRKPMDMGGAGGNSVL